ncbi:MAG: hypothetical protein IKZ98_07995 [Clostridia bacterium]|nr:hypothetical protein [Clostridia bacterium]
MYAFIWKRITVLKHTWIRILLLILLPVVLTLIFCAFHLPAETAALYASVCGLMVSSVIVQDPDDFLLYEVLLERPVMRLNYVLSYFIVPGLIIYVAYYILAVFTASLLQNPIRCLWVEPQIVIIGGVFSVVAFTVKNGQLYNYRQWVANVSIVSFAGVFVLPILTICDAVLIKEHILLIFSSGAIMGLLVLTLFMVIQNKEKSLLTLKTKQRKSILSHNK